MSLENIYKKIANLKSKKLKRDIFKYSQQQDSFFAPQTNLSESTREKRLKKEIKLNQESDLGYEKPKSISADEVLGRKGSLSTRYAPDMPGLQVMRYSDGVYQNPYTGKMYDYNEGFELDGAQYGGGSPSLQSSIMTTANEFKKSGLYKEARLLKVILNQLKK